MRATFHLRRVALTLVMLVGVLFAAASTNASAAVHPHGLVLRATVQNPTGMPDVFGDGVAIWGDTLLVGAPSFDNGKGRAYIYVKQNNAWPANPTVTLHDPHNQAGDDFGYNEVALYLGTAVVCAFQAYNGQGACYVYVRSAGGVWPAVPTETLRDPTRPAQDGFGISVAIWAGTIVIGTENSASRAAYVYTRGFAGWPANPTASLKTPDEFGFAVAIYGNSIMIGDPDVGNADGGNGVAYVFVKAGGPWPLNRTCVVTPPVPANAVVFGWSVTIDRFAAAIGDQGLETSGGQPSSGAVYIYKPNLCAARVPVATLLDPRNARNDSFGYSLAISGGSLVVGAPFGSTDNNSDWTYVYKEAGAWPLVPTDMLEDPNTPQGYLGDAVAIQGSTAAIPSPNAHQDSGVVYVYTV